MVEDPLTTLPDEHVFNAVLGRLREDARLAGTEERKAALKIALGAARAILDEQRRLHLRERPLHLMTDPVGSAIDDAREMLGRAVAGHKMAEFSRLPTSSAGASDYVKAYEQELARLAPIVERALRGAIITAPLPTLARGRDLPERRARTWTTTLSLSPPS